MNIPSQKTADVEWRSLDDQTLSAYLNSGVPHAQSQAFGVLYDRYQLLIWNYVLKQLDYDESVALEAFGDTWLVFWQERTGFVWQDDARTDNPLKSWLFAIARNRIKSFVRHKERERENVESISLDDHYDYIQARLADHLAADVMNSSPALGDQRANRLVNQGIKRLKPTEQQIVLLRYYKGLSHAEIGERLGKSSGAIRTAHTRLLAKLRELIG
ncbi:sigma-70 family RNA polymerase sigma factor [Chloroflexi bacterium TSY]|nr:sigma-70 family RNA polymerase sigma factor [Chloroflexi bacterium TSY]